MPAAQPEISQTRECLVDRPEVPFVLTGNGNCPTKSVTIAKEGLRIKNFASFAPNMLLAVTLVCPFKGAGPFVRFSEGAALGYYGFALSARMARSLTHPALQDDSAALESVHRCQAEIFAFYAFFAAKNRPDSDASFQRFNILTFQRDIVSFLIVPMALPADYHMHTPLCLHAVGEPEEYARRALELGLPEMGMSDHSPMRQDDFDEWRMNFDKLAIYVDKVRQIQKDFPQLHIKMALEVDYFPNGEDWVRELAGMYPWDYFIGSVHYVSDDWAIDDPKKTSGWKNRDAYDIWRIYFDRLTSAAESGLFEIIGHADLPKKFGHEPPANAGPLYEKFLNAAKKSGCAVELNTAGLRKDCTEIYPSREILQLAFQKDVPITFGSDAHAPGEVGMNFAEAVALARSVGYTKTCRFEQRRKQVVSF